MLKQLKVIVLILIVLNIVVSQTVIRNVNIYRANIFDDSTQNLVEKAANSLHTMTKESVIKNELLFGPDDTLDEKIIYETERNLRRLGFIGDVHIEHEKVNDSLADVKITTHDRWTLTFNSSLKREGGITSFNVAGGEDNFLGYGKSININYNYVSDRSNPNGYDAFYRDYKLFGSDLHGVFQYKNSEDLFTKTLLVEKPFYTEATSLAAGMYYEKGVEKKRLFENGEIKNENFLEFSSGKVWTIYSSNGDIKYRLGTAFITQESAENEFFKTALPHLSLWNISFGVLQRSFSRARFVNNLGMTEDVPFGYSVSLVTGKVFSLSNAFYFNQTNQLSLYDDNIYYHVGLSFYGYMVDGETKDAALTFQQLAFLHCSSENIIASRFNVLFGNNWSEGRQVFLDSKNGLRGIPAFMLSGRNSFLFNIEDRLNTQLHWWIFDLGLILFADIGTVTNHYDHLFQKGIYKSVGLGLRIFNSKQQGVGLTRIDFAYNLNRKSLEVILSANQLFSAFAQIDTTSPIVVQ